MRCPRKAIGGAKERSCRDGGSSNSGCCVGVAPAGTEADRSRYRGGDCGYRAGSGDGYLIGQTIASIHRQPEAFEQTRTLMFLGIGLVEAFALYGIVFALLIAFVL